MFYTYIIESLSHPDQRYIGHTTDLHQRLTDHNAGKCPHSSKFKPWKIKLYVAFEILEQAQHFEQYLKSGLATSSRNGISGDMRQFRDDSFSLRETRPEHREKPHKLLQVGVTPTPATNFVTNLAERIGAGSLPYYAAVVNGLRIFVDLALSPADRQQLESGAGEHELVFPQAPLVSVLGKSGLDPKFATVDVAFGQPDTQAIAQAKQLKWIHVSSSGITRYDTPEFRALMAKRKIALSNSASVFQEACAVHALSFMLAQARKLPRALSTRVASSTPEYQVLREASGTLRGETVLIVGYGAIGARLAELLRPFGMNIIACRRNPRGDEGIPAITLDALDRTLSAADHVMNILPDSAETRDFFSRERLSKVKSGAVFYNIGRGVTVDQAALNEALRAGHFAAAWLDVTEPEPLPDEHPLWSAPNCFITPHTAGGHPDETGTLVAHFLENLDRFVRGEPLRDRVM